MSVLSVAIITKLQGTPAVTAAAPGGVYKDFAPAEAISPTPGVVRTVVVVNTQFHEDEYETDGRNELAMFLVKAVGKGAGVSVAAQAIYATLQDGVLNVVGMDPQYCHREEVIEYDEAAGAERYGHQGGIYSVGASL